MTDSTDHKRRIRRAFTKQAESYATNPTIADSEWIGRLVDVSGAHPDASVLEVGTGPGHVAFEFAEQCGEVVGLDLTGAPLRIAQEKMRKCDVDNLTFIQGDAENVPFADRSFDIVCCRLALHHVENSGRILHEMARVCRPNGYVVVEDLTVSEHPSRAEYQNQFERLRDTSHVRALPISELLGLFTRTGLEVELVETNELQRNIDEWLAIAETPENRAEEVRKMISKDAEEDLSGTQPFWQNETLHFVHRTAIVVGRNFD